MKKALSVVLALALVLSFAQAGMLAASAYQDGDYTYTVLGMNATITDYTGSGGNLVIPQTLGGGYVVSAIGPSAFAYCPGLTSVTIPAYVTSIGNQAFTGCPALTQILVNGSNTSFSSVGGVLYNYGQTILCAYPGGKSGAYAVPPGITQIKEYAFQGCALLSGITLLNFVTAIGSYAFEGCAALPAVTIPASVTSIGLCAFGSCAALTQINVEEANTVYSSANGVLFNEAKTKLITYPAGKTGYYAIPAGVTEIGTYAFLDCAGLTGVDIPSGVTVIGTSAFMSCAGITDFFLPATLTEIRSYAFFLCSGLTGVYIPVNVTTIGNSAFQFCDNLQWAFFLGNAPATFGSLVFDNCGPSFTVYYESTNSGFSNPWYGYTAQAFEPSFSAAPTAPTNGSVTVTVNYPVIAAAKEVKVGAGDWAAYTVPVVMTENGTVYARCANPFGLTSPEISYTVANIDHIAPSAPTLSADPTSPTDDPVIISISYPPDAAVMEYKIGGGAWEEYKDPVKIGANDTVYARCFDEVGNVSDVGAIVINYIGIYDYVYTIAGGEATLVGYNGSSGDLVIPDTLGTFPVVEIANGVFQYNAALTSVVIPDTVRSIGNGSFYRCEALHSVSLPEELLSVGESAFEGCIALTAVTIPAGTDEIRDCTFRHCDALAWAYFRGDAPYTTGAMMFDEAAPGFTVWYRSHADGFDKEWNGYKAQMFEPELSASPLTPTNGNVTVTIDDPAPAFVIEYKVAAGLWTVYTGPVILTANATVYARCADEYNYISPEKSIDIGNIDKVPPDAPVFHAVPEYDTTGYVTVSITFPPDAVLIQYALAATSTDWETYTGPIVLWHNDFVNARCFDAAGNVTWAGLDIHNIITISEGIIEKRGSTTVIDRKAKFIYGLQPGMNTEDFELNFIETVGGARLEYVPESKQITTGLRVNVYSDHDVLLDSYVIVIFGDVNGDGNIDTADAGLIIDFENFIVTWDPEADAALYRAADLNSDGNIDTSDAGIIVDYENFMLAIDQVTGMAAPL